MQNPSEIIINECQRVIHESRDPMHQDYLDACQYDRELRDLEQMFGCPVDMFGQPIKR